ncbi:O-acetyltransferase [Rhodococcus sp. 06-412-2C]|uniref:sugar O-acetyltransferase n=1 Tax=unclassified Rhodococcus (in: high G+C Gram-positive bacteria) TaxID=192944 RepID=UPI000B9AA40D|nr:MULTISPECIES: sugar O-acetyltransferase [unclassified Rhodococcus (in: high G+C Gram-positive bacteria)]OZC83961.1 O-acetyltransferase [Rhodococcus sp. 06-412-2C]OZC94149.1 O-acetyltransferase [Rhodococcus sp. 06-412-2B]
MNLDMQRSIIRTGAMYNDTTPELVKARERTLVASDSYNASFGRPVAEREALLSEFLGSIGTRVFFEPTFRCEFGYNVHIGNNFYANFDCILLDGADILIGDNVLFGPRVSIYTANHAVDPVERAAGACYAKPVTIGSDVWVGGGVTINQGVSVGDNVIIGSGSVVTRDIPANVIAVGVPAAVRRQITESDRTGYMDR